MRQFLFGGEFYFDDSLIKGRNDLSMHYLVSGGRTAIHLIVQYMKKTGMDRVLLPFYLCPSIIDEFDKENINIQYYSIDEDFSFDKGQISRNITPRTLVYFINYFGLSMDSLSMDYIRSLQAKQIVTVYDAVHDLCDQRVGTFSFNSYRKIMPYSLTILRSEYDLNDEYFKIGYNRDYYEAVRMARNQKKNLYDARTRIAARLSRSV